MEKQFESEENWKEFIESIQRTTHSLADETIAKNTIKQDLIHSLQPLNTKFALLFSGGLDSSILAVLCKQLDLDFTCYCVGFENSQDVKYARKISDFLGVKSKIKILTEDDVLRSIKEVIKMTKNTDVTFVAIASALYAALEFIHEDSLTLVVSGNGAEEIFYGYKLHESLENIDEKAWERLKKMYTVDIQRDLPIASHFGITLFLPFLDQQLIQDAMSIPASLKISGSERRIILRKLAIDLGLGEYSDRKKSAFQYGTKCMHVLQKLAKKNNFKYKRNFLQSLQ